MGGKVSLYSLKIMVAYAVLLLLSTFCLSLTGLAVRAKEKKRATAEMTVCKLC